jgi:hypothetical protein
MSAPTPDPGKGWFPLGEQRRPKTPPGVIVADGRLTPEQLANLALAATNATGVAGEYALYEDDNAEAPLNHAK